MAPLPTPPSNLLNLPLRPNFLGPRLLGRYHFIIFHQPRLTQDLSSPHEKPAAPAPSQTTPAPPPLPVAVPSSVPPSAPEPPTEPKENGWEAPTTVEAPTWDDEPQAQQQTTTAEAWPPSIEPQPEPPKVEVPQPVEVVEEQTPAVEAPPAPEPKVEVKASPAPIPTPPAPISAPLAAVTPSPKLTRPVAVSHRSSARHKVTDQPVTMPLSFGSGIEKVGMQFGSLSLAGDGSVTVQCVPISLLFFYVLPISFIC